MNPDKTDGKSSHIRTVSIQNTFGWYVVINIDGNQLWHFGNRRMVIEGLQKEMELMRPKCQTESKKRSYFRWHGPFRAVNPDEITRKICQKCNNLK
jgi:hypothetical protein